MAALDAQDVLNRLRRLDHLVAAYGHVLVASELDRPLPSVVPLLVREDVTEVEAGALVKEMLRRGGADLVTDLEEVERVIRQAKKDPEVTAALREVRLAFRQTARLHAGALARRLGRAIQAGALLGAETGSLQKELEAFISGVARVVREDDGEIEEVFAEEDLLTSEEEASASQSEAPRSLSYKEESQREEHEDPPAVDSPDGSDDNADDAPWSDPSGRDEEDDTVDTEEGSIDALRDRVDVYNDMLSRWAAGETFLPESSQLVRRGMQSQERCVMLHRDLLQGGARRLVEQCEALDAAPGGGDDRLRYLRSRIADGLANAVPRLLAVLVSGEALPADMDQAEGGRRAALDDLTAYLNAAVDLFDEASPHHARLSYLAAELRSAARQGTA